jgi:hypothetical protein
MQGNPSNPPRRRLPSGRTILRTIEILWGVSVVLLFVITAVGRMI